MTTPQVEFSRVIAARDIPEQGRRVTIAANDEERARLARRLAVRSVELLVGAFDLSVLSGDVVEARGRVRALVGQTCVVTLEDMTSEIDEPVVRRFAAQCGSLSREVFVDPGEEVDTDPLIDGGIDLGELAAETLAIALEPYPRKAGAKFASPLAESESERAEDSPFARLAAQSGPGRRSGQS